MSDKHKHEYLGGKCVACESEVEILDEDEVNDEEVTRYKRFGVG